MPKHFKYIIAVVLLLLIYSFTVSPLISLHNQTVTYSAQYSKMEEQQKTNFEGYYLAFKGKYGIADINKETFLEATNIIMSNRHDGENVTWKWLQENQPIDMQTFSVFYRDLSEFVNERFQDNMLIERQKQEIVRQHNLNLEVWPNNLYNKILRKDKLEYKAGVIYE